MKLFYSLAIILVLAVSGAWAAPDETNPPTNEGVFTSVTGKVQAKKSGNKTRVVKNGSIVKAGEKITTSKDGKAVLRFFDGSELKVSPKTQFTISKLEKQGLQDKAIKFKLAVGDLWASVKKLSSSKSSFEIESGGVVCGVRGTKYSYSYNPDTKQVTVHVDEGTVYLNSDGHTFIFTAGQTGNFSNGEPGKTNPPGSSGGTGGETGGNNGNQDGNASLGDLNQQFGSTLAVNGDNTFTDPAVGGSAKVGIHGVVPPQEDVP